MNKKGADTFPFAFTGSLRMKTRHSCRNGCPHRIGMNINNTHWVYEQTSSKTEASLQTAFRLLLLRKRNQFLRLFLCEREIIVNALFLLKCLGNGQNQIQVQRYKYYLKINNILWKRIYKETNNAFFPLSYQRSSFAQIHQTTNLAL